MEPTAHNIPSDLAFLNHLKTIIRQRKALADQGGDTASYTASLFRKGINKIAQKVGEEAVELVIEAKDDNAELFKNEAADLVFHLLILLEAKSVDFSEIVAILKARHQP